MTTSTGPSGEVRLEAKTSRLRLVALDPDLARLQASDRAGFFKALGTQPESMWPPELDGRQRAAWIPQGADDHGLELGWHAWVFLLPIGPSLPVRAVGLGGFFGPPNATGEVEIAYSMLPSFREQGLATEAVEGLLYWARRHTDAGRVVAHTPAHLYASRRVLEKTGFNETGEHLSKDGETVVRYSRPL